MNKFMAHSKLFLLTAVFFAVILSIPSIAHAAGVSPGTVVVEDLMPGTSTVRNLSFSRSDTSVPQLLKISIEGPAASSLSGAKEIEVPINTGTIVYPLTINAGTLAAGTYTASIVGTFTSPPPDTAKGKGSNENASAGSAVVTAARAQIRIIVTNTRKQEFSIKQVLMPESEVNQPLGFSFTLTNTGNVDARPSKIALSIVDQNDSSYTYNETFLGESLIPVKAFTESESTILTKAALPIGRYFATFDFLSDEKKIYTREKYPFQIFPAGTLAQEGELKSFAADKETYEQNELIVLNASFQNKGHVGLSASLVADVSKNGNRTDLLKTDPVFIPAGRTADLSLTTRLAHGGTYTIKGVVQYGIYKSNEITATIDVKGLSPLIIGIAVAVLVVILALIFLLIRKHKKSPKQSPVPPAPPADE